MPRRIIDEDPETIRFGAGVAREAGDLLRRHLGRGVRVRYKGWNNLVTDLDERAQRLIVRRIRGRFPEHQIVAEEAGLSEAGRSPSRMQWFVDPLDGTTNYAHGYPVFCVSMALAESGRVRLGVVHDPCRDETFTALRGGGAWLNGDRLRVSKTARLDHALLATGFSYERPITLLNLIHFRNFILSSRAVRRDGSAALDLCYTAAGRFDGFWELNLNPWDVAAGALLIEEAGGCLTDFGGRPFDVHSKEVVASNGRIHRAMRQVLARARRGPAGRSSPKGPTS